MRTVYTSCTALPSSITRATVIAALRDHESMIELNPLVKESKLTKPIGKCLPEEYSAVWYEITDKVSYLPGGLVTGNVTYHAAFHDLPDGLQTHCYAPLGVDIQERWSVGGNEPGEPIQPPPMGIGAPAEGLYLREDIDMRCNFMTTSFVKKNLKNAHSTLVSRLVMMAQKFEVKAHNERLAYTSSPASASTSPSQWSAQPSPIAHPSFAAAKAAQTPQVVQPQYPVDRKNEHLYVPYAMELDASQAPRTAELE